MPRYRDNLCLAAASYIVARSAIHDVFGLVILLAALAMLWSKWKIPDPALVGAGAACGLVAMLALVR